MTSTQMTSTPLDQFCDTLDSREIVDRLADLAEIRRPWVAGWNMPGYMPEMEPCEFETWAEARDFLAEEVGRLADAWADDGRADLTAEAPDAIAALDAWGPDHEVSTRLDGEAYWISRAEHGGFETAELFGEWLALSDLTAEAADYSPDWADGVTLVRDSHLVRYAQEFAEEVGAFSGAEEWPLRFVDWNAAALDLAQNWTAVEFRGVRYWVR